MAHSLRGERGSVLVIAILILFAVTGLVGSVIMLTADERILSSNSQLTAQLNYTAEYALEAGLSRLNHDESALPDTAYTVLLDSTQMVDASGDTLPVWSRVYLGRTGSAVGQMGNFASLVAEAGVGPARTVKRLEVIEESFAKFAYFTDTEGNNIGFGGGDQILGPLHSNDEINIWSSGARFHDEVSTSEVIDGKQYGQFDLGYTEGAPQIELPDLGDLDALEALAAQADYVFDAPTNATASGIKMRVEFVAIDVNGDGDENDTGEGFFRIYRDNQPNYLRGDWNLASNVIAICGDYHRHPVTGEVRFFASNLHQSLHGQNGWDLKHGVSGNNWNAVMARSLRRNHARCFLGGDPNLTTDGQTFPIWNGNNGSSGWLRRSDFAPNATIPDELATRPDAEALFPLHRLYNGGYRGVVFVDGSVGVSGRLNGRVTLVTDRHMAVLDDLTYVTPPNTGPCADILGLIAARDIALVDNALNTPQEPPGRNYYKTYDETTGETIHAVVMALDESFFVERYNSGPRYDEPCEGDVAGRGCLYLGGGLIQERRGPVGTTSGTGYIKRYSYDANARYCPPPHYPSTGRYHRNRYYDVSPSGFDPGTLYERLAGQGLN